VVLIKEDARIMANLLKSGHKMLSLSCPICNNPVFQNKSGTTFCAICNREVLLVNKEPNENIVENKTATDDLHELKNFDKSAINSILIKKIRWIVYKLENETQLHILNEYLEVVLKLMNILEKSKELKLS